MPDPIKPPPTPPSRAITPKPTMFVLPLALLFDPGSLGPFNFNTLPGTAIICIDPVVGPGTCRPISAPGAPGPAPLLGLGAGLHWSRRLRRRIREAAPVTIPMEEL